MSDEYVNGIAFIMEGATEKVFYRYFMEWMSEQEGCKFEKVNSVESGEILFEWSDSDYKTIIKFNVVGTITQVVHSGKWFKNTCAKKYNIPWTVFLCYDTDSSDSDITKFYKDDWKLLRDELKSAKAQEIIDLAAQADIEDVMLYDLSGVCSFLKIQQPQSLCGRKGKAKMKALYRSAGKTYHEGDRAADMIRSLNFKKIAEEGPISLVKLQNELHNHNI